jgi:type I restriction enzyme R subunit
VQDIRDIVEARLAELDRFWEKEQTKGEVKTLILDQIYLRLPTPSFSVEEKQQIADSVYGHIWQQAVRGVWAEAA